MSEKRVATVRTTMPALWVSLLMFVAAKAGWDLSDADWQVLLLVAPVVTGVVYRLGRELEGRWPSVGRVLFGSSKVPHYD